MTDQLEGKVDEMMIDGNDDEGSSNLKLQTKPDISSFKVNGDVNLIARLIEKTLRALLVQIGIAVRARIRLQNVLESIRVKCQSQSNKVNANIEDGLLMKNSQNITFSTEDLIVLQQFNLSPQKVLMASQNGLTIQVGNRVPNYQSLERECMRYKTLTSQLVFIVDQARASLQSALPIALEREAKEREEQRIRGEKAAAEAAIKAAEEAEVKRVKDEEAAAAAALATAEQEKSKSNQEESTTKSDAIVIDDDDDDDDDDDVPLAGRPTTGNSKNDGNAIDLTDESPALKTVNLPSTSDSQNDPSNSTSALPTDPVALLARLTAAVSGSSNSENQSDPNNAQNISLGGMENFDFSSFGLNNPASSANNDTNKDLNTNQDNLLGNLSNNMNLDINDPNNTDLGDSLGDAGMFNFNSDQFDGVDLSFLNDLGGGSGGSGTGNNESDNNLLGNIDFSALLGGGGNST